jgi:hypothetical protein
MSDLIEIKDKRNNNLFTTNDGDTKALGKVPGFEILLQAAACSPLSLLPVFTPRLRLVQIGELLKLCQEGPGEVLKILNDDDSVRAVRAYLATKILHVDLWRPSFENYDVAKMRHFLDFLTANLPVVENVAPVRFLSDPGFCWRRLDFDLADDSLDATALDGFLSRCSDPQAVGQWIGSLFVESPREQYLWLHGEGGDGKSTLVRFLARLLGDGYRSRVVPQPGDRFWTAGVVGASLVAFNDTNNYGFPASGLFKSLTGGDAVQVEEKGKPLKNVTISAKFIFTSNEKPKLSSERADRRRAIYIEVAALPDDQRDWNIDNVLWNDRANIISQCVSLYQRMKSTGGQITCDLSKLDELISDNEMEYEAVFEKWFIEEPGAHIAAVRFAEIMSLQYKQRHDGTQFRAWLSRSGKSKSIKTRIQGLDKKIYINIREKNYVEKVPNNE